MFSGPSEEDFVRAAERERLMKQQRDARTLNYLAIILGALESQSEQSLQGILATLPTETYVQVISEVEFYAFLVQLHQMGEIPLVVDEEMRSKIIDSESSNLPFLLLNYLDEHPEASRYRALKVQAGDEELIFENLSRVTDYRFSVHSEGKGHDV